MTTDTPHTHPATWPFAASPETEVTTTRQVLEGAPVLRANHSDAGAWLRFRAGDGRPSTP